MLSVVFGLLNKLHRSVPQIIYLIRLNYQLIYHKTLSNIIQNSKHNFIFVSSFLLFNHILTILTFSDLFHELQIPSIFAFFFSFESVLCIIRLATSTLLYMVPTYFYFIGYFCGRFIF